MKTAKQLLKDRDLHETTWGKRIIEAEENCYFTEATYDKADGWLTCACGEASSGIEKRPDGSPADTTLRKLGIRFVNLFEDYEIYQDAESYIFSKKHRELCRAMAVTLIKIEDRAVELAMRGY